MPLQISSTPCENAYALVSSIPAISFGEMAGEVTNFLQPCVCHVKGSLEIRCGLIPLRNRHEGLGVLKKCFGKRARSTLVRPPIDTHARAMTDEYNSCWMNGPQWRLWDCEAGEETTSLANGPNIFCNSPSTLGLNQQERPLV